MNTELAVHQRLVALTPSDIVPAQRQLVEWCTTKMRELGHEYRDLHANLVIAKRNRWRTTALIPAVKKLKQRIQYYQKMREASKAGYLIIPNLPIEVIAVRVESDAPRIRRGTYPTSVNEARAELLPADTGRYVDDTLPHEEGTRSVYDKDGNLRKYADGKPITERWALTNTYDETVDFPLVAVKPIILEATADAMKRHIFDRIGVAFGGDSTTIASARRRRADPMVVGQLIDPRSTRHPLKVVSFFIAWWLDTADL